MHMLSASVMLLPLPDSVQRPSRYCSESPAPFLERLPRLKTGVDAWAPVQSRELSIRALFFTGCYSGMFTQGKCHQSKLFRTAKYAR